MKTTILVLCAGAFCSSLFSQEVRIEVVNPAPFDRPLETVEVQWRDLAPLMGVLHGEGVGVFAGDRRLTAQTVDNDGDGSPDLLLFQSGFLASERKRFLVKKGETPETTLSVTDAKYILPRKDIAWENDRIAYRIYGGPLAGDVLDGLDVWVKRVRYHIIDKWYAGDSLKGSKRISYHVDHGEGADLFLVGRSLGAGGSARWINGALDQAGLFTAYRIISTGPVRAQFSVRYERDSSRGRSLWEEKTYSLDAGMNLNRIEIRYPPGPDSILETAVGLVKRTMTTASSNQQEGWLALWGPTDSDTANGSLGAGVVIPPNSGWRILEDSVHDYVVGTSHGNVPFTYFAGAGWTRSGDFSTVEDWQHYLSLFARSLRYPLEITVSSGDE